MRVRTRTILNDNTKFHFSVCANETKTIRISGGGRVIYVSQKWLEEFYVSLGHFLQDKKQLEEHTNANN